MPSSGDLSFEVKCGFFAHVKTLRLQARLGLRGPWCLLRLWSYAAQGFPSGVLRGHAPVEVESVAGWDGTPGELHSALVEIGWLEADGVTLHDWPDEQPYVIGRPARIAKARAGGIASGAARRAKSPDVSTRVGMRAELHGGSERRSALNPKMNPELNSKLNPRVEPQDELSGRPSGRPSESNPVPSTSFHAAGAADESEVPPHKGNGAAFDSAQDAKGLLTVDETIDVWNEIAAQYRLPSIAKRTDKLRRSVRGFLRDLGEYGDDAVVPCAFDLFARQDLIRKNRYGLKNFLPNADKYTPEAIEKHGAKGGNP